MTTPSERAMTWAALLGKWTEFAQSALALPDDDEGGRLREAVPAIIGLQAVTHALAELDDLEPDERALGIDRAEMLIRKHAGELNTIWRGEEMPEEIIEIVDLMIASLEKRLQDKDMAIELTPPAKALLAERGYDPTLGARPLRRTIQREIEDPLSEKMLFGDLNPGSIVVVDVEGEGDERTFSFTPTPKAELPDAPPIETAEATEQE